MDISRKTKNAVEEISKNALENFNYYSGRIDDLGKSMQEGEKRIEILRADAGLSLSIGDKTRHDYLIRCRIPAEQVLIKALKNCITDLLLDCRQLNRTIKAMKRNPEYKGSK